ncbi:MAG TPA: hypothetical protein DCK76_08945 [Desulfotomaculum sp.]|nr:hypothetical protein [Desulfotomaculum sp.]HBY04705.1 hypothetical protein [Desulfotomaculum sp.]
MLCFLLLFGIAYTALAAEMPLMPMVILGKVVDQKGSAVNTGSLEVFIGDKYVTDAAVAGGQVDISLDQANKANITPIDSSDIGKAISFKAVIDGKEYNAGAEKEITFKDGGFEGLDSRLLITVNYTSSGSGQQGGGSGGQGSTQAPASPAASPAAGTYAENVKIELSCSTAQTVIYFTSDSTDPKTSSARKEYKEPISISQDTVIKAVSLKDNLFSAVSVFDYKISHPEQQTVVLSDIQGHWAAAVIQKMAGQGVISGYEDKTFRPNNPISRAECAAIIDRALDLENGSNQDISGFSDAAGIPEWAGYPVAAVVHAGLLKGYPGKEGKTVFMPQKQITRVELATIMARVLNEKSAQQTVQKAQFNDSGDIPGWAAEAVDQTVQKGVITGYPDGSFKPGKNVTRAEAAAMIDRLLGSIK